MFNIALYNFDKKINSTARPSGSGSDYSCTIKNADSILTPVVEISGMSNGSIPLYNYAYIPAFKRYYFIDDISYGMGTWLLSMHVDVLASFALDIKASTQYVIRSASEYDETIADSMYLSKAFNWRNEFAVSKYKGITGYGTDYVRSQVLNTSSSTTQQYFNKTIEEGYFIVGIVGNNTTGVDYYSFSNSGFKEFINEAMTFTPSDMTDVSSGLANAVFNPLQYITSVRWFPTQPYISVSQNPIKRIAVAGYTIPLTGEFVYGGYKVNVNAIEDFRIEIDIPKHPKSVDHDYLNLSPFTQLNLVFQPFGCIPLDTSKLLNSERITVQWLVDYCGGSCVMNVYRSGQTIWTPEGLIYTVSIDCGVQLPISSLVMDWKAGLAISALSWIKDSFANTTGNILPTAKENTDNAYSYYPSRIREKLLSKNAASVEQNAQVIDKAMDISASALGQISTVGSVGSFLAYMQDVPYVMAWFRDVADEEPSRFGRPLYKVKRLSTLTGFTVCLNASVPYSVNNPMAAEQSAITYSLNSGIFLE